MKFTEIILKFQFVSLRAESVSGIKAVSLDTELGNNFCLFCENSTKDIYKYTVGNNAELQKLHHMVHSALKLDYMYIEQESDIILC